MQPEDCGKGSVPCAVYRVYIQALGGCPVFLFILALFVLNVGSTAFSNWWLSYWIKQGSGVREHEERFVCLGLCVLFPKQDSFEYVFLFIVYLYFSCSLCVLIG